MKRKLVLINPANPLRPGIGLNILSRFPPLGLGVIAGLTPKSWDLRLVDENWGPCDYQEADLVGITAITSSVSRAYEIASRYRGCGTPVVMGGVHASMCPAEAGEFADAVVIGEAENIWPQVLADAESGRLKKFYQGEHPTLANLPLPRHDLFHPNYLLDCVETSRGCPMNCEFCCITMFNGKINRRRPPGEVLQELVNIPRKILFFVDGNILGNTRESREQALELFKSMAREKKINKWWFCMASLNFGEDDELLYWAAKAGCKMVFIGIEAEEAEILEEVRKGMNLRVGIQRYHEIFKRIHRAGISVLGSFLFGMDGDSLEALHKRTEYMMNSSIDAIQVTYLTPLPGTRLFQRLEKEGRLLYTDFPADWSYYDFSGITYLPKTIGREKLREAVNRSFQLLYSWPRILKKALRTLVETGSLATAFFAWQTNICYRRICRYIAKQPPGR
jgi:radical SAM superfamily enzyme YgiQ (UPF0313 family)